ncbi:hypothetical protein VAB18032_23875 [Micromonospora maris AB-18-032]|nr:hypothetical protein VAB18032_23875 [Micromonospora maris AB-18-032]
MVRAVVRPAVVRRCGGRRRAVEREVVQQAGGVCLDHSQPVLRWLARTSGESGGVGC